MIGATNKKGWILAFVFVAAGGIFVLLSQKIPSLVERWLHGQLSAYGVETFHIGDPYWGLSGAGTTKLSMSGQYKDWLFTIEAGNLVANYHWRTLLDGEVHSIAADSMHIQLHQLPAKELTDETFTLAQLLDLLNALHLPVASVHLATLALDAATADVRAKVRGNNIRLDNADGAVRGTLHVATHLKDGPTLPDLRLTARQQGPFRWVPNLDIQLVEGTEHPLQVTVALETSPSTPTELTLAFAGQLQHKDLESLASQEAPTLGEKSAITIDTSFSGRVPLAPQLPLSQLARVDVPFSARMEGRIDTDIPTLGLKSANLSFNLALANTPDGIEVVQNTPFRMQGALDEEVWQSFMGPVGLSDGAPLDITIEGTTSFLLTLGQNKHPSVEAEGISVKVFAGAEDGLRAHAVLDSLKFRDSSLAATLQGSAVIPWSGHDLPPLTFTSAIATSDGDVTFSGNIAMNQWRMEGEYRGTYTAGALNAGADIHVSDLSIPGAQLSQYNLYDGEIALATGQGSMSIQVTQTPGAAPGLRREHYNLTATEVTGIADGVAFTGARLNAAVGFDGSHWFSIRPFTLQADEIRAGVVMTDFALRGQLKNSKTLEQTHWHIDEFGADLFGGKVELDAPADVDFPFSGNSLLITLSNLRLADILRLYENQGVSGNGILNGEIPLVLEKDGVQISNGRLTNTGDGRIVFASAKSQALQATNQQLAMALRLLEDFNYRTLSISVEFQPSGDMLLGVQLWGSNPAEFDGRQVNFNINLEENLYDLFKVLRLTDEVTKKLEQRLEQQGYR